MYHGRAGRGHGRRGQVVLDQQLYVVVGLFRRAQEGGEDLLGVGELAGAGRLAHTFARGRPPIELGRRDRVEVVFVGAAAPWMCVLVR